MRTGDTVPSPWYASDRMAHGCQGLQSGDRWEETQGGGGSCVVVLRCEVSPGAERTWEWAFQSLGTACAGIWGGCQALDQPVQEQQVV